MKIKNSLVKYLTFLGRNSGVSANKFGENSAQSFNTQ